MSRGVVDVSCEGPLLVHHDGSMSCEVPGCDDARTRTEVERAVARHRVRVACDDPGRPPCIRCHPPAAMR
jgi:hypothetical protein